MQKHYRDKVLLITGGSSGIGRSLALQAAKSGARVCIVARTEEALKHTITEINSVSSRHDHLYYACDLSSYSNTCRMADYITGHTGGPDIIINSAGAAHPGYFEALDEKIFRWMMEANYFTTLNTVKAFIPVLIKKQSGHIVNISSVAGYLGVFGYTAYGASKFAITGLSKTLRAEMKRHSIKVSVVYPPDTHTPQYDYENQFKPAETKAISGTAKALNPDKVAYSILRQMTSGRFNIHPSFDTAVFYSLQKLLPDSFIFYILDYLSKPKKNQN